MKKRTTNLTVDLKEEDYFGTISFIDGKLNQVIVQRYSHTDRIHTDEEILRAVAEVIAADTQSSTEVRPNASVQRELGNSEQSKGEE